jgi:flagellar protein FlaG
MASELSIGDANQRQPAVEQLRPPQGKTTAVVREAATKVAPPKPNDIKFDAIEATKNLKEAVSLLNHQLAATGRGLGFSFDESKASAVIKVSNINTGEVIRQIPTEDVLRMAHKMDELKGILYNKLV